MGYEPLLAMRGEETLIWTSKSREKVQVFDFRFVRVGIVHAWRRESHTVTQIQQELWTRTDQTRSERETTLPTDPIMTPTLFYIRMNPDTHACHDAWAQVHNTIGNQWLYMNTAALKLYVVHETSELLNGPCSIG